MARLAKDAKSWFDELTYIETAWPSDKASFRGSQSVFNEYVEMQAQFCEQDGYPCTAHLMRGYKQFVPHGKRLKEA